MRTTVPRLGTGLLALGATTLLLDFAYLLGYWNVFDTEWRWLPSVDNLSALSWEIGAGLAVTASAFVCIANRLKAYALGGNINTSGLVITGLGVLAAMYCAAYDEFTWTDAYPFAALFIVAQMLFRVEKRVVAATLIGIMLLGFYAIGAKELGERDGERTQFGTDESVLLPTN